MTTKKHQKVEFRIADECVNCNPQMERLTEILDQWERGISPQDMKLILELNTDWLGRRVWHLDNIQLKKR